MNDEELVKAWLEAEGALYGAQRDHRAASHAQTESWNRLSAAQKAEKAAWLALNAHREKLVDGRL